jgi:hypothetical protein
MFGRIATGTFPVGICVGVTIKAWLEHELDLINRAAARGADDDELRDLVKQIYAARKA